MDESDYSPEKYKSPVSAKINFWFYWNFKRRAGNFGRWLIWKLPKRVIYWCVVRAAVEVEPNYNPTEVRVGDMLEKFNYN